ncbi:isochorismatase of siderophore biosynthesis [Blastochloris viridis]|uniref:Isochorismatase of siderophore biosynthesis n=2 Tax=Blastochloris viridis TaxID=1079 RepID=A0A182D1L8_BLAVI|nr:isochorismatase of siderophore biosynthesis [Blastochloris viridis]
MERAVLLIHDMQRYFVGFFDDRMRYLLINNIKILRQVLVSHKVPIAYSAQPGGMNDTERGLLKDFWGPGMKVAPEDRNVVDELRPEPGDWILTKWRYSAFFRSDLLARMKAARRDQIILCGVYAHVGVIATAVDAFSNDIKPFLVADATADFSEDFHRSTLTYAAQRCAHVTTVEEVLP